MYKQDVDLERKRLAEIIGTSPNSDVERIITDGMGRGQDVSSIVKAVLGIIEAQKLEGRHQDSGDRQN